MQPFHKARRFLVFALCVAPLTMTAFAQSKQDHEAPARDIPHSFTEGNGFFALDERTDLSHLKRLRETVLPEGDIEMRLWMTGRVMPCGYRLCRSAGVWSGSFLPAALPKFRNNDYQRELSPPAEGWERLWSKLEAEGIRTLPDSSALKGDGLPPPYGIWKKNGKGTWSKLVLIDGIGLTVELSVGNKYRVYHYSSPAKRTQWPEAKHMDNLYNLLYQCFPPIKADSGQNSA